MRIVLRIWAIVCLVVGFPIFTIETIVIVVGIVVAGDNAKVPDGEKILPFYSAYALSILLVAAGCLLIALADFISNVTRRNRTAEEEKR